MKHLGCTRHPASARRVSGLWEVVRSAFEERLPSPRKRDWRHSRSRRRPQSSLAAAFSPPGNAVLGSLRDAVRGEAERETGPRLASGAGASARRVELGDLGRAERRVEATAHPATETRRGRRTVSTWPPFTATNSAHWNRTGEFTGQLGRTGRLRSPRWSFDGFRVALFRGPLPPNRQRRRHRRQAAHARRSTRTSRVAAERAHPCVRQPSWGHRDHKRRRAEPQRSRADPRGTTASTRLGERREGIHRRRAACRRSLLAAGPRGSAVSTGA